MMNCTVKTGQFRRFSSSKPRKAIFSSKNMKGNLLVCLENFGFRLMYGGSKNLLITDVDVRRKIKTLGNETVLITGWFYI
jgi:hypothetical protein